MFETAVVCAVDVFIVIEDCFLRKEIKMLPKKINFTLSAARFVNFKPVVYCLKP